MPSGRKAVVGVKRDKFFAVRLTAAEKRAIKHLERELTESIRRTAAEMLRAQQNAA